MLNTMNDFADMMEYKKYYLYESLNMNRKH